MPKLRLMTWLACGGTLLLAACSALVPRADACGSPLSARVENSCVVTPAVLWRGAKPDAVAATELVERGARTIVNLELALDDREAFRQARPQVSQPVDLAYFRIREWEPNVVLAPGRLDRHVAEFIAIASSQPRPIYVHCRSGQNRTGVMVAAYRVLEEHWPVDTAIAEMAAYQGLWFQADADYIRQLVGERAARLRAMSAEMRAGLRPEARLVCTTGGCT